MSTCAGFVVLEKPLELWKGVREWKIVALMNVHALGSAIIRSIIEGNSRIGMAHSFAHGEAQDLLDFAERSGKMEPLRRMAG